MINCYLNDPPAKFILCSVICLSLSMETCYNYGPRRWCNGVITVMWLLHTWYAIPPTASTTLTLQCAGSQCPGITMVTCLKCAPAPPVTPRAPVLRTTDASVIISWNNQTLHSLTLSLSPPQHLNIPDVWNISSKCVGNNNHLSSVQPPSLPPTQWLAHNSERYLRLEHH